MSKAEFRNGSEPDKHHYNPWQAAVSSTFAVLSSLYDYLMQVDYVLQTAEQMAEDNSVVHERTLFVMAALFAMYLRVSELVADERSAPVTGDFKKDGDNNRRRSLSLAMLSDRLGVEPIIVS